jgi:hypothetical protein
VVGADGVRSGLEPTASGACSVGGVSFRGGERRQRPAAVAVSAPAAVAVSTPVAAQGVAAAASASALRRQQRRREETRGGVAWLDSTPTRRILECFVGPFPAKTGPPNSSLVFYRVVFGLGFYTRKPAQTRGNTLAPNEALGGNGGVELVMVTFYIKIRIDLMRTPLILK